MNPAQYRAAARSTRNNELTHAEALLNATLGLGEAGELQNIIKKQVFHGHAPVYNDILDEVGDVLYYLDWLLDLHSFTLNDAMHANVSKLAKRYPNGFSADASINRSP